MNKNDRRRLRRASLKYCSIAKPALDEFIQVTESLKEQEEEKLENLPESLQNSRQAINIEESIDHLEELEQFLQDAEIVYDSVADCTDITPDLIDTVQKTNMKDTGPRNNRFQILLSDFLISLLKLRAMQEGCSCNELICRSIQNELLKNPND